MLKILFVFIVLLHGLIHLMGFSKAFGFAELKQMQPVTKFTGVTGLLATLLFIGGITLFIAGKQSWWVWMAIALLVSQFVILQSWRDAKWGSLANLLILLPVLVGYIQSRPTSFRNRAMYEAAEGYKRYRIQPLVTESDIARLPAAVQKYLRYTNVVGKPGVQNMKITFAGEMRKSANGKWRHIDAVQYSFWDEPTRIFYIKMNMTGLPVDGLHLYKDGKATMQIKAGGLVQVADAHGEKMTRSETVTMFNDMCLMAPATLISPRIEWIPIDSITVRAQFANREYTISAILYFNEQGQLVNFESDDRYQTDDGKIYHKYKWSTPVSSYRNYHGVMLPEHVKAVWHTPQGSFDYARFTTKDIEYNNSGLYR